MGRIPLFATRLAAEVSWTLGDFIAAGALLVLTWASLAVGRP